MRRAARPMTLVYDPEKVAQAIMAAALARRREVIVGGSVRVALVAKQIAPGLFDRWAVRVVEREHFQERTVPPTAGNLFGPDPCRNTLPYAAVGNRPDKASYLFDGASKCNEY